MSIMPTQSFSQSFSPLAPSPVSGYGNYPAWGSFNSASNSGYSGVQSVQPSPNYLVSSSTPNPGFNPGVQYSIQSPVQPSTPFQQAAYRQTLNPAQYAAPATPSLQTASQSVETPTWGPKPMSGGPPLTPETDSFSTSRSQPVEPPSPKRHPSTAAAGAEIDELAETPVRRRPGTSQVGLTPGEKTVKRLEQPLIRFLNENPQIREKIDGINMDTVTADLTKTMGSYRVSIHNAYNKFPRVIDNAIISQFDPQMQDSARQFFQWIRKPPTAQELAENRAQPARGNNPPTRKRARTSEPSMDEPPAKASKTGWWPFKRKAKAEPDLSSVNLDTLLNELQSRNI